MTNNGTDRAGRCKRCGFHLQPDGLGGVCVNQDCAKRGQTQAWGTHAAMPRRLRFARKAA